MTTKRRERIIRSLVERAEREGFVLYQTNEDLEKLAKIQVRILDGLDDISCFDGFLVLLGMTAFVAACGAYNKIDSIDILSREAFLKNCAERYDRVAQWHAERLSRVNTDGGDA